MVRFVWDGDRDLALEKRDNVQFVFVSESSVLVKGFDYVCRQLAEKSPSTSNFCLATPATHELAASQMTQDELWKRCTFQDFYHETGPETTEAPPVDCPLLKTCEGSGATGPICAGGLRKSLAKGRARRQDSGRWLQR
mmetsp:Transcript_158361/g.507921  ORF Transcript_158361/g.507921 Transcript_158361/m.507921 type:complete len:138 (-) Transcript_158361:448-861(-)